MMKSSRDTNHSITNPSPGIASYWISRRRKIIYQIFKDEILDRTTIISSKKIKKAISKLGEEEQPRNENRIRTFVHRLRKEQFQNTEDGLKNLEEGNSGAGRCRYWTKQRREIIQNIFKKEISDGTLLISRNKIKKAIEELGEEQQTRNESRIRTFVHLLRKKESQKIRDDSKNVEEKNKYNSDRGRCTYWTEKRRKIIRDIFENELQDRSLRITRNKIMKAIIKLRLKRDNNNENKIRTFVHRIREEEKEKIKGMSFESAVTKSPIENFKNLVVLKDEPESYIESEPASVAQSFAD